MCVKVCVCEGVCEGVYVQRYMYMHVCVCVVFSAGEKERNTII